MKTVLNSLLSLCLILFSSTLFAGHHKQQGGFNTTELKEGFTLLQGKGGNVLLNKGKDGLLIIDDDYADMSAALKQTIKQVGDGAVLKYLINTHWHGDHSGGNAALGADTTIVAHHNVRARLSSRQENPFFNIVSEAQPAQALPDITYPDALHLHFNGEQLVLQHYPNGHTDGDTVVYFKQANIVHMGDHMFNAFFPFVDMSSGGNAASYRDNVGHVLTMIDSDTIVVPGHGPITDKHGLEAYHQMLSGTISEVEAMKKAGKSLTEVKNKGLSKQWQRWNMGFVKEPSWIEFIYRSLP